MQDKPIRCAYAYATTQPIASNAIYQRGRYYVTDNTGKKDRYRYNIFFSDLDGGVHLLGLTGTVDNAKRYTNSMYHAMPMAITLVETQTEQAEKLGKKYRVRLRPEKKEKQIKSPVAKVKAPKVKAPKVKAPKVKAPKVKAPKVKAPKVKAPKVKAPKVKAPKPKAEPKPKATSKQKKSEWDQEIAKIKKMPVDSLDKIMKAQAEIWNLQTKYFNSQNWKDVQKDTNAYLEELNNKRKEIVHKNLIAYVEKAKTEYQKQNARTRLLNEREMGNISNAQFKILYEKVIEQQARLF